MNIQTPHSRSTDPEASHMAGEKITKSGKRFTQQQQVKELVQDYPGCTAPELASFCNLDRYQVNRRLSDLDDISIVKGPTRKCKELDSVCSTWWPL